MEDLQFRRRGPAPQEGVHVQFMIGIVLALFCAGTYLAILTIAQHERRTLPDHAEWVALAWAAPFAMGTVLAIGNAVAMYFDRHVSPVARSLPVFIALSYFAWFFLRAAFN